MNAATLAMASAFAVGTTCVLREPARACQQSQTWQTPWLCKAERFHDAPIGNRLPILAQGTFLAIKSNDPVESERFPAILELASKPQCRPFKSGPRNSKPQGQIPVEVRNKDIDPFIDRVLQKVHPPTADQ